MKTSLFVLALLGATPALALDCMAPDPLARFWQVHEAKSETWVVLLGQLDTIQGYPIPDPMAYEEQGSPALRPTVATFTGMGLSVNGFDRHYTGPVQLQPICYGSWCGAWPTEGEALLFAQVLADGIYVVPLDPCGQSVFSSPSTAITAALTACMAGGAC